jgi:hypothetical protein
VTFAWTAPADDTYAFDTIGSAFDTVLYARRGLWGRRAGLWRRLLPGAA